MSDVEAQALLLDAWQVAAQGGRTAALYAARAALDVARSQDMRQWCEDAVRWYDGQVVSARAAVAEHVDP